VIGLGIGTNCIFGFGGPRPWQPPGYGGSSYSQFRTSASSDKWLVVYQLVSHHNVMF